MTLTDSGRELRDRAINVPTIMIRRPGLDASALPTLNETLRSLIDASDEPADLTAGQRTLLAHPA